MDSEAIGVCFRRWQCASEGGNALLNLSPAQALFGARLTDCRGAMPMKLSQCTRGHLEDDLEVTTTWSRRTYHH